MKYKRYENVMFRTKDIVTYLEKEDGWELLNNHPSLHCQDWQWEKGAILTIPDDGQIWGHLYDTIIATLDSVADGGVAKIVRKFTKDEYRMMTSSFNKKSFSEKIKVLIANPDVISIGNDGNWFVVKATNSVVQEWLEEEGLSFDIENEWTGQEPVILLDLLGVEITDV